MMIKKMSLYHILMFISSLLLILLPAALISGPFLPDLFITLIALIFFILYNQDKGKEFLVSKTPFFRLFIIFFVFIVIGSIFSDSVMLSLKSSVTYIRFGIFSVAIIYIFRNNKKFIKFFYLTLLITLLILLFDGYFQFFTGKNTFGYTSVRSDRLGGLFFDELILGSFISKILPILITFVFLNKEIIHKNYIILLVILSYGLVFLSGERSAFLTTTLYLLMITPFLLGIKKTATLFLLLATICAFLISTNKNIKSRYVDQMLIHIIGHPKAKVFMPDHIGVFTSAINIFKKNIYIGGGVKTFRVNCKNTVNKKLLELKTDYPNITFCNTHPHNYYLQLLAETGLAGFLFVLAIFIKLFVNYFKQVSFLINKKKVINKSYICILAGLIVAIWPLATTGNFFNNWICSNLFLTIGIYLFVSTYEIKN
jgi:O-antigen ligase